jgi:hypothetical protein
MTTQEERRNDNGRRESIDRRQTASSMISHYANYSGPERRSHQDRREATERRAIAS